MTEITPRDPNNVEKGGERKKSPGAETYRSRFEGVENELRGRYQRGEIREKSNYEKSLAELRKVRGEYLSGELESAEEIEAAIAGVLGAAGIEETVSSEEAGAGAGRAETPEAAEAVPEIKIDTSDAEFDAILEARRARAAREMVDVLTGTPEAARAVVEGAAPADLPLRDKEKAVEELGSKEGKRKLYLRMLDRIKNLKNWEWKELAVSAGAGGAARMAIRLAFGSSLGVGIAASALGGGVTRGVREYRKERKFTAASVLGKLGTADRVERAAILARAEEAYKKGRVAGNEEELGLLADELRVTRSFLETVASPEAQNVSEKEKDRILAILKIADGARKEVSKTRDRKDAEALIKEINFERKKVDRKKVAMAVVKGAAAGAVGGAIAGALADHLHFLSHGIFGHGPSAKGGGLPEVAAPKLTMPQPIHVPSAAEAFREEVLMRKAEAAAAATKESLEKAQTEMLHQKFGAVVEKGEGATHVARKIIHDYLVNEQRLNPDSFEAPSLEQLVYMEDTLKSPVGKIAEKGFHIGDHFDLTGDYMDRAYQKAMNLKPEQLSHPKELLQEPAHRISSKNIEMMTNLDDVRDSSNNFYGDMIEGAQEAAAKAAAQIEDVIPPQVPITEAAQKGGKEAVKTAAKSSASKILKLVGLSAAGGAVGGGLGYGAYRLTSGRRRKAAEGTEVREREATASPEVVSPEAAPETGAASHEEALVSDWESEGGAVGGAPGEEIDEAKKKKAGAPEAEAEEPENTEKKFNRIASSYMKKGVMISAVDDSARAALINRSSEISRIVEEVGTKKFDGYVINFFKPVYGGSARMFVGNREIEIKKKGKVIAKTPMRVLNVNVDSPVESIKRFVEDSLGK